jgi:hypothetical protein
VSIQQSVPRGEAELCCHVLSQDRGKRGMVCPEDHARMGARWAVIFFVGQYCHYKRIRALRVKTVGETLAGSGGKLMAKQQDSAPPHADFEEGGAFGINPTNLAACSLQDPSARAGK